MAEAKPVPPQPVTLYVKPYVRKYVLARLGGACLDSGDRVLWDELQRELRAGRELVAIVPSTDPYDRPSQRLELMVRPGNGGDAEVSYFGHRYITAALTKAYLREMFRWVEWSTTTKGWSVLGSLEAFRRRYGISEDDQQLATASRMYRGYLKGRSLVKRSAVR